MFGLKLPPDIVTKMAEKCEGELRIAYTVNTDDPSECRVMWLDGQPLMIEAIIDWEQELMDKEALNDDDDAVSNKRQADENEDSDDEPE